MYLFRIKEINKDNGKIYCLVIFFILFFLLGAFLVNDFIYFYFLFERSLIPIYLIITG
jgi:NADH:ubiquinone oxidoreductase subunit 4 (subunit M)